MLKRIERTLRRFRRLEGEVGLFAATRWLIPTLLRSRTRVPITIRGIPIEIRASTSDLEVALDSLCGEFDQLIEQVGHLEHDIVVDAGGCIGTAAIVFSKAYPDAKILTIEPSPENFKLLSDNVRHYPNIVPVNGALTSESGRMELYDRGMGDWGHSLLRNSAQNKGQLIATVDCVSVADLLKQNGAAGIDIIKIDIEGGEKDLFSRNTDWVDDTKAICIELHERIVSGCTELFEQVTNGRRNTQMEGEKMLSMAVK